VEGAASVLRYLISFLVGNSQTHVLPKGDQKHRKALLIVGASRSRGITHGATTLLVFDLGYHRILAVYFPRSGSIPSRAYSTKLAIPQFMRLATVDSRPFITFFCLLSMTPWILRKWLTVAVGKPFDCGQLARWVWGTKRLGRWVQSAKSCCLFGVVGADWKRYFLSDALEEVEKISPARWLKSF